MIETPSSPCISLEYRKVKKNDDVATGWNRSNFYAIFSVNRYSYCVATAQT